MRWTGSFRRHQGSALGEGSCGSAIRARSVRSRAAGRVRPGLTGPLPVAQCRTKDLPNSSPPSFAPFLHRAGGGAGPLGGIGRHEGLKIPFAKASASSSLAAGTSAMEYCRQDAYPAGLRNPCAKHAKPKGRLRSKTRCSNRRFLRPCGYFSIFLGTTDDIPISQNTINSKLNCINIDYKQEMLRHRTIRAPFIQNGAA